MSQVNQKKEDDIFPGVKGKIFGLYRSICVLITVLGMMSYGLLNMNDYLLQVTGTMKKNYMMCRPIC
eukprot:1567665-Pyramimonas_sp.AAC.1